MARVVMNGPKSSLVQPSYSHTHISHLFQRKYICIHTQTSESIMLGQHRLHLFR